MRYRTGDSGRRRLGTSRTARSLVAILVCAGTVGACAAPERASLDRGDAPLGRIDRATALAGLVGDGVLPAPPVPSAHAVHTVRPGDTLALIARERLGRMSAWREIARLNGIDDPASLEPGQRLRLSDDVPERARDGSPATLVGGQPDVRRAIGLGEAVAAARAHDAVLEIVAENADIVRAGVPLARSALLPQANLQASVARFGAGGDRDDDYTESQVGLQLGQTLFDRVQGRELAQARLDADAAELRLLDAHETLVLRTADAYFAVLRARSELEFRSSDRTAIGRQLAQARQRFSVGASPSTDRDEALARRDLADVALVDAANVLTDALEAFEEVTGLDAAALELAAPAPGDALARPDPDDADAWVALAERYNASLGVARAELESAQTGVGAARAARLPTFALEGNLAEFDSDDERARRADGGSGSISLVARLPLFTGGLIEARVDQASAAFRLAEASRRDVRRGVVRGTRTAYRDVVASVRRVAALEQALVSSRQAAGATRAGFDAGTRTSVEVLESERNTLRAVADLSAARYAYLVERLELQRVSGTLTREDIVRIDALLTGREAARP